MDDEDLLLFTTEDVERLLARARDALRIMKASVDQLPSHEMPAAKLLHIEDLKSKVARYQTELAARESAASPPAAPQPTYASVNALLYEMLILDPDFDAFCMDALPNKTHRRFGSSADRSEKHNLLLKLLGPEQVVAALRGHDPKRFAKCASLLVYRNLGADKPAR